MNVGIPRSEETKLKLSVSQKGRPRQPRTEQQKLNHKEAIKESFTPERLSWHRVNQLNNPVRIAKHKASMNKKYALGWNSHKGKFEDWLKANAPRTNETPEG